DCGTRGGQGDDPSTEASLHPGANLGGARGGPDYQAPADHSGRRHAFADPSTVRLPVSSALPRGGTAVQDRSAAAARNQSGPLGRLPSGLKLERVEKSN